MLKVKQFFKLILMYMLNFIGVWHMTLHDEYQERRRKWIVYRARPVVRSNDAALVWAIITALAVFGLTVLFSK